MYVYKMKIKRKKGPNDMDIGNVKTVTDKLDDLEDPF